MPEIASANSLGITAIIALVMVLLTVIVHYEVLRATSSLLLKVHFLHGRTKTMLVIMGAFLAHIIEIVLYTICFYLMINYWGVGYLGGEITEQGWFSCFYYSISSYTSLGIGDVIPHGNAIRLLTGIETLNGLVLIGWSASFTYLYMEKFWKVSGEG